MVNRYYICDSCDYIFMVPQPMHEALLKKCPRCKKHQLYQDLTNIHTFVYQEPKTLGHQADRNTDRMSKYELETKTKKKKRKNAPWYNPEGKDLSKELKDVDTKEKAQKYIMGG